MNIQRTLTGALLFCGVIAVHANAGSVYTNTVDLIANPPVGIITEIDGETVAAFAYDHLNPTEMIGGGPWTPAEYEQAVLNGLVTGATLEITIDDLDLGELGGVILEGADGTLHPLGVLDTLPFADVGGVDFGPGNADPTRITSTTFPVDPSWLNGLPVGIIFSVGSLIDEFELESSTLAVSVVPEPATLVLAIAGLGMGGLMKRRKSRML